MGYSINSYKTEWTDNDNIVLFVDLNGFKLELSRSAYSNRANAKGKPISGTCTS